MAILVPQAATGRLASRLNWLRAGVLGANDGIVSTAGIVMGVAGATADSTAILIAGLAGMVAGALSMAGGEYVSVSSQRDTEVAAIGHTRDELASDPDGALDELARQYRDRGVSPETAHRVASELTAHDPLGAHAEIRLGISAHERTSPWQAALASAASFVCGAIIPLLAMTLAPSVVRVPATVLAVLVATAVTGQVSATLSGSPRTGPVVRNVSVGVLAMTLTYVLGHLAGLVI